MIVRNVRYYYDLPFEEYLTLPGVSYSSIKGFNGEPSAGMRLGTRVHQYINEPGKYDWEDSDKVRIISLMLRKVLGSAISLFKKEVSFTADFIHNGMILHYKGRADMIRIGKLIVDLKVLSGGLTPAIQRFGYDRQQSGYCLATGTPLAILVSYNKTKKITETRLINPDAEFWEYQTVRLGAPQNQQ